ncbi:ABC transporter substrate-binding protein [Arthrobacter caoxuetaonis]|uniref:ABC transporter substrate-binding protein n=1 Tax=Arthrobacter caoxuetaonis TaxID=2886935 RepID=A0A9X1MF80_9MICC|nr:ABC transporter substrate-binding protein [Arthrobacter caoxuetaonis]MCC3298928.1 ABC transporter substrate-binding protein [Arthrobacter caoxuetaonis]USQ58726.1 ABC transporter substrate-binding protein [Arthrobacter caoxuetaonis]
MESKLSRPTPTQSLTSRRTLLGGAGLGLLTLALGACSTRETVASGTGSPAASGTGFSVTDMRGKTITFDAPVQRIATTVIPSPSMIAAVDGGYGRIVGINESTLQANQQGLFGEIFPEAKATTTISPSSFTPNIETITELAPDVVFQWADQGDGLVEPLENAGFKTVCLLYGTQEYLETWVHLFADILGKPGRGTEITDWMHAEIERLETELASVSAPVRVVHLGQSGEGYSASNKASYMHYWMELAGGQNMAADNVSTDNTVSAEQLIEWDPEVITLGGFDARTPADVYTDSSLASVSAVRNKRVYKAPLGGYRWEVPCAESPLMWQWAAELYHPELTDHNLRATMREKISYLYNYDVSEKQIDAALRLDMNRASAGYSVFEA